MFNVVEVGFDWIVPAGFMLDRREEGFPFWIIAQYFNSLELHIEQLQLGETANILIILPPKIAHWYVCHMAMSHNWLHIQGNMYPLLERYHLEPRQLYTLTNMPEITDLFHAISRSSNGNDLYRAEYMKLKVEEMLLHAAVQIHQPQEMSSSRSRMLRELRHKIMEHPDEDWTVQRMAARLYVSESYLFQLYRQCFGVSPAQDVSLIRAERARAMLSDGMPVSFVAERCGYSSVYSFIRSFKRVTGTTPGQYRPSSR